MILISYTGSDGSGTWQWQGFTRRSLGTRTRDGGHKIWIPQDVERFFESIKVIGADQNERGAPVTGHEEAFVFSFDSLRQF